MNSDNAFALKIQETKENLAEKWNGLMPRERMLLVVTAIVLVCIAGYFVFASINRSMDTKLKETEEYRKALTYIADNRADYAKNTLAKEQTKTKLLNADAKIVSRLSSMASNLGFDVTVTPKDARKTSDDSGAEEQEIEVSFKGVDYSKFLEYVIQIHKLDTPVYMRHLSINRTSNNSSAETKMTVSITLMSYRLKEQNAT